MRGWKWADFWGFLMPDGDQKREEQDARPRTRFFRDGGSVSGKVLVVFLILAVLGLLAAMFVAAIQRLFGGFQGLS
jgi:hypothetical protein